MIDISLAEHLDTIAALGEEVGACRVRLEIARAMMGKVAVRKALQRLQDAQGTLAAGKIRTLAFLSGGTAKVTQ